MQVKSLDHSAHVWNLTFRITICTQLRRGRYISEADLAAYVNQLDRLAAVKPEATGPFSNAFQVLLIDVQESLQDRPTSEFAQICKAINLAQMELASARPDQAYDTLDGASHLWVTRKESGSPLPSDLSRYEFIAAAAGWAVVDAFDLAAKIFGEPTHLIESKALHEFGRELSLAIAFASELSVALKDDQQEYWGGIAEDRAELAKREKFSELGKKRWQQLHAHRQNVLDFAGSRQHKGASRAQIARDAINFIRTSFGVELKVATVEDWLKKSGWKKSHP